MYLQARLGEVCRLCAGWNFPLERALWGQRQQWAGGCPAARDWLWRFRWFRWCWLLWWAGECAGLSLVLCGRISHSCCTWWTSGARRGTQPVLPTVLLLNWTEHRQFSFFSRTVRDWKGLLQETVTAPFRGAFITRVSNLHFWNRHPSFLFFSLPYVLLQIMLLVFACLLFYFSCLPAGFWVWSGKRRTSNFIRFAPLSYVHLLNEHSWEGCSSQSVSSSDATQWW